MKIRKIDHEKLQGHTNNYLKNLGIEKKDDKLFTKHKLGTKSVEVEIVPDEEKNDCLKEIYENLETKHNGRDSFYYQVRKKYANISKEYAFAWLKKQTNYQMHYQQPREPVLKPLIVRRINSLWQFDLIDMKKNAGPHNRRKKWILTCIDTFSKYAWALPLPNKKATTVREALEEILKDNYDNITQTYPKLIQSDNAKEFVGREVSRLFVDYDIKHIQSPTYMAQANACIERFNRTLKGLIYSNFDGNKWVDKLPTLVKNYNNSYHSTIKDAPVNIHKNGRKNVKQAKIFEDLKDKYLSEHKSYPPLEIMDKVRVHILTEGESRKNKLFAKKFVPQWSKKIYWVTYIANDESDRLKRKYSVEDRLGNYFGSFYRHDLQKI